MYREIPESLPLTPDKARSFQEWFEWGLKMSQREVAIVCGTTQPRIANIANGHAVPRATLWEPLLRGMQLPQNEFLRLTRAAVERRGRAA